MGVRRQLPAHGIVALLAAPKLRVREEEALIGVEAWQPTRRSGKGATLCGAGPTRPTYEDGSEDTRRTSQRMTFRITRALDSLLTSAKAIKGDKVAAEDMTASGPSSRQSPEAGRP